MPGLKFVPPANPNYSDSICFVANNGGGMRNHPTQRTYGIQKLAGHENVGESSTDATTLQGMKKGAGGVLSKGMSKAGKYMREAYKENMAARVEKHEEAKREFLEARTNFVNKPGVMKFGKMMWKGNRLVSAQKALVRKGFDARMLVKKKHARAYQAVKFFDKVMKVTALGRPMAMTKSDPKGLLEFSKLGPTDIRRIPVPTK